MCVVMLNCVLSIIFSISELAFSVILLLTQSLKILLFVYLGKNVGFEHRSVSRRYMFLYAVKALTLNKQKNLSGS